MPFALPTSLCLWQLTEKLIADHTLLHHHGGLAAAVHLPGGAQCASAYLSEEECALRLLTACALYLQTLAVLKHLTVNTL